MMRFLRAFAWLRWRLLLNGVRGSRRRDVMEQLSRLLALALPAAIVALSLGSVIIIAAAGLFGGAGLAANRFANPDLVVFLVRLILFGTTALVVFMPVGGAAQTTSAKFTRLLLLPIPLRAMHFVEVLSGLADPWLLFVTPGLVLFAAGLFWGGRLDAALFVAAAGAALAAVLASLSALIGFVVNWLFRNRRRAEMLTIAFVLLLSMVAVAPQYLEDSLGRRRDRPSDPSDPSRGTAAAVARVEAALPAWTAVLPSEAYGRVVTSVVTRSDRWGGVTWLAVLMAEGALCFWLSGLVYRRLLDSAGGSSSRQQRTRAMRPPWRLPGLSGQTTAVAWAMVRGGLRSVRGRLSVLLPGPLMALVWPAITRVDTSELGGMLGGHTHLVFGISLLIGVLAIQPFTMNQFASDRAGLTLQFLMPVSSLDLVRGKAIGGGVLFLIAGTVSLLVTAIVAGVPAPLPWLLTALAGLAVYVTITPLAGLMSAMLPVPADMSKAGSGGNPHSGAAIAGMFALCIAVLPPLVILVPGLLPVSPAGSLILMCVWLCVVALIAWALLGLVARVVAARRENLFLTR